MNHSVRVHEQIEAQSLELAQPGGGVPVVLMIAGDEVLPVRRRETGEGRNLVAQRGREPVGDVPR